MAKPLGRLLITACATAAIVFPMISHADERCHELETLWAKYAGVELTSYQKEKKRELIVWYNENCRDHRVAGAH